MAPLPDLVVKNIFHNISNAGEKKIKILEMTTH